jgi:hypothetical protein
LHLRSSRDGEVEKMNMQDTSNLKSQRSGADADERTSEFISGVALRESADRFRTRFSNAEPARRDDEPQGDLNPVLIYLKRIGDVGLLSRDEEVTVAREMEEGAFESFSALLSSAWGHDRVFHAAQELTDGVQDLGEFLDAHTELDRSDTEQARRDLEHFAQRMLEFDEEYHVLEEACRKRRERLEDDGDACSFRLG